MKNTLTSILLCALFLLFGFAQTAQAATTWVVTKTADTNDGVCDADCSLREAIAVSQNGDTINFSSLFDTPQTIVLDSTIDRGQLTITKSIQINGPVTGVILTKSAAVQHRIIDITTPGLGYVGIFNLTMTNGYLPSDRGAGIKIFSGDVYIVNCLISNNRAFYGAGIASDSGNVHLVNSTVRANTADTYGGGIYSNSLSVRSSTISNNLAPQYGGGIYSQGSVSIINSIITGNVAYQSNCNPPTYCYGGGIAHQSSSPLIIRDSTIASNSSQDGGGIWSNSTAAKQITNSIIADNTTTYAYPDVYGSNYNSLGNNLIGKIDFATGFTNGVNGDIVGTIATPINPMLGPLQDNGGPTFTRALLPGSPAINAGNNATAVDHENGNVPLTVDQRGLPRISTNNSSNSIVDIGAFEKQSVTNNRMGELRIDAHANPPRPTPFNFTTGNLNSAVFSLVDNSSSADPYQSFFITSTTSQTYTITESDSSPYQLSDISCTYVTSGGIPTPTFTRVGNSLNIQMQYPTFVDCTFVNNEIVTAANVSIGGRVLTNSGRGISNVRVSITDTNGNSRTVLSSSFGYYHFDEISAGQTYILQAQSKRYQFANPTQILSVNEELSDVNFTAYP
jgi:CSLREA domain-containing protein